MAFRFASPGTSAFSSNTGGSVNGQIIVGPELEEIQTEVGLSTGLYVVQYADFVQGSRFPVRSRRSKT